MPLRALYATRHSCRASNARPRDSSMHILRKVDCLMIGTRRDPVRNVEAPLHNAPGSSAHWQCFHASRRSGTGRSIAQPVLADPGMIAVHLDSLLFVLAPGRAKAMPAKFPCGSRPADKRQALD